MAYSRTHFYNNAHGALGLGISPFTISFFNIFVQQYPVGKRQFAIDIFYNDKDNDDYSSSTSIGTSGAANGTVPISDSKHNDGYLILGKGKVFLF